MAPQMPLPDEQEFDQPHLLGGVPNQDLDFGNNAFYYFTSSPWFDTMCINVAVINNLQMDPNGQQVMSDRSMWDERLRREPTGVQFMIAGEPQAAGQPWVLQRQNKVANAEGRTDMLVEGNWYMQGTKLLMAPSLLHVVQSRLLSVATRMQQMADISKNMTHWSPAAGYSYFPPSYGATKPAATASRTASRVGSPTLAPVDPDAPLSQSQGPGVNAQSADATALATDFDEALFMQSLTLTNKYGHEYMDENPLKGEPGAFVFENTRSAVDARNKAQEQAAHPSQAIPSALPIKVDTQPLSVATSSIGTPTAPEPHSRKASIAAAPKKGKNRRKSQAGLVSPTTPAMP